MNARGKLYRSCSTNMVGEAMVMASRANGIEQCVSSEMPDSVSNASCVYAILHMCTIIAWSYVMLSFGVSCVQDYCGK